MDTNLVERNTQKIEHGYVNSHVPQQTLFVFPRLKCATGWLTYTQLCHSCQHSLDCPIVVHSTAIKLRTNVQLHCWIVSAATTLCVCNCSKTNYFTSFSEESSRIGNESVTKIVINDVINLKPFLNSNQHFGNLNHNSFQVLFDKIPSVYFIWKIYLYFSTGNGQPGKPALCQLYWYTFVPYSLSSSIHSSSTTLHSKSNSKLICFNLILTTCI